MPNVKFRASGRTLTSQAGLSIIGQCFDLAGIDSLDGRFPTSQEVQASAIVTAYLGLLCLGISDYDAIENFRRDKPFLQLLNLQKAPSTATLHQRLEKLAAQGLQERTATWSQTLLSLTDVPLLVREDSGFDSQAHLALLEQQRQASADDGRVLDYLVEWKPRDSVNADLATIWLAVAEDYWEELHVGKRQALWTQRVSIIHDKVEYKVKRAMRLVERTTQPDGQFLLQPDYKLEGWWTTLDDTPVALILRYQAHATHEQFHSEIKTDLDLERLPSGKFATNDLILHLAYNILRLMGQLGMTGELSPVRHPTKRRRLRMVLHELVHRAALVVQLTLDFGQDIGGMTVLTTLRSRFGYPPHHADQSCLSEYQGTVAATMAGDQGGAWLPKVGGKRGRQQGVTKPVTSWSVITGTEKGGAGDQKLLSMRAREYLGFRLTVSGDGFPISGRSCVENRRKIIYGAGTRKSYNDFCHYSQSH